MDWASLQSIEKRAYISFHSDGLWEMAFGMMILAGVFRGMIPDLGAPVIVAQLVSIAVALSGALIVAWGKKRITIPRIGYVRFGKERKRKLRGLYAVIILGVAASIVIWVLAVRGPQDDAMGGSAPTYLMPGVITMLLLTVFAAMAYFLDYPRFYAYAVLIASREPVLVYLTDQTELKAVYLLTDGIPALVLLIIGSITLRNFMKRYPLRDQEVEDG